MVRCGLVESITGDRAVAMAFFFDHAVDEAGLTAGLALALDHVPLYAGRFRKRGKALDIVCSDDGASMSFRDSDMTLDQAMRTAARLDSGLIDHIDTDATRQGTVRC